MSWKTQGDPTSMPGSQDWLQDGVPLLSPLSLLEWGEGIETSGFLETQPRGPLISHPLHPIDRDPHKANQIQENGETGTPS